jgi:hypothetical protein
MGKEGKSRCTTTERYNLLMPWCPKCRDEYNPDATRCVDCDVDLVKELPPDRPDTSGRDWVHLTIVPLPEAQVVRALLEDKGISAHIDSEEAHTMLPLDFRGVVGVRILVPNDHLDDARRILSAMEEESAKVKGEQAGGPSQEQPHERAQRIAWATILAGMLIPFYAFFALKDANRWLKMSKGRSDRSQRWMVEAAFWLCVGSIVFWAGAVIALAVLFIT